MNDQTTAPAEATEAIRPRSNLAVTIARHRPSYAKRAGRNGRTTQDNGDEVATALLGVPLPALKAFSALRFEGKRYDHLNDGHARMCIGNNIRQAFRKGDTGILAALLAHAA